jgi:hypothetical protein
MTHVKRIRQSLKYPETKVDIIVATKNQFDSMTAEEREPLRAISEEYGEVEVPQQMIYIKQVFEKYKGQWPLNFNT